MGENVKLRKKRWMSYAAAKQTVQDEGNIKSRDQYRAWHKAARPAGMPKMPERVYPEWTTWGDFLGVDNMFAFQKKDFWTYPEALKWLHKQDIKTREEYYTLHQQKKLPKELPYRADLYYKDTGWVSWMVFLGKRAIDKMEGLKVNISILAICIPKDLPGGYLIPVVSDTPVNLNKHLEKADLQPIKFYKWKSEDRQKLMTILKATCTLKNSRQNLWLTRNVGLVVSELDLHFDWYQSV